MNAVKMTGIVKHYPMVTALDGVDFTLREGEVHALLGENGAGKSTLMNVLYGMTRPDAGTIRVRDKAVKIGHPADARRLGIGMVHQQSMLAAAMTVTENIILGSEPTRGPMVNWAEARKTVTTLIRHYGLDIPPDAPVSRLTVGQQKQVETLITLYQGADIIILDEPTAALTPQDIGELFSVMRKLRDEGKSIILITHKLAETVEVAGRVSMLSRGTMIAGEIEVRHTSVNELAQMMAGRNVETGLPRRAQGKGAPLLQVGDLNYSRGGRKVLSDINLTVHRGEIYGIAGLDRNGQPELEAALTGGLRPDSMELIVGSTPVMGGVGDFIRAGIGHIPASREARGLVMEMSVEENLILGYHRQDDFSDRRGLLRHGAVRAYAKGLMEEFDIRAPEATTPCARLSGGTQQKVVLARVLSRNPDVVIAAQPTRNVDSASTEFIHNYLRRLREAGKAILLISSDLDEVSGLADRMGILYRGRIVAEGVPDEMDEMEIGLYMTGEKAGREVSA